MNYCFSALKNLAVIFFLTSFLSSSCKKNTETILRNSPDTTHTTPDSVIYQLTWADEFDGTTVNASNWNFETGGNGWGNNEKEFYQAANATVSNGNLIITAKKENVNINDYTSARMTTKGKVEFTYGKIEARIMIPVGQGLWPAFWMLGANISSVNWPACGETDIMEHINSDSLIYSTIHWDNNGHASNGGNTTSTPSAYHVYAVEWNSASIRWYIDGVQYFEAGISTNDTDEFHKPFFIILNLAVGGNWPGQTIDESKLPANMYIDYVRVYKAT